MAVRMGIPQWAPDWPGKDLSVSPIAVPLTDTTPDERGSYLVLDR